MAGNDNKHKQEEKMVEEQIIPLEKYNLVHNWKLIMQFDFSLFINKDEFVIINNNDEYIARFSITDVGVIELKKTASELTPKIDFKNRMIKIPNYYKTR
ncbi:hypothetical protein [Neobacillus sp. 19]|uniref:hypothetical protein n=1 Tax=Neobacillus sp. 19 TaxID=3394458 RepID=UPI003BF6BDD4